MDTGLNESTEAAPVATVSLWAAIKARWTLVRAKLASLLESESGAAAFASTVTVLLLIFGLSWWLGPPAHPDVKPASAIAAQAATQDELDALRLRIDAVELAISLPDCPTCTQSQAAQTAQPTARKAAAARPTNHSERPLDMVAPPAALRWGTTDLDRAIQAFDPATAITNPTE